jgi:hypothetical protein
MVTTTVSLEKFLTASDGAADDQFGQSESIDGDTIVVGAFLDDDMGNNSGSAYIFERNQGELANWWGCTCISIHRNSYP